VPNFIKKLFNKDPYVDTKYGEYEPPTEDVIAANEVYQSINEKLLNKTYQKLYKLCDEAFKLDIFSDDFIIEYNNLITTMDNLCKDNPLLYKIKDDLMEGLDDENIIISTSYVLYYLKKLRFVFGRLKCPTSYAIFPYSDANNIYNHKHIFVDDILNKINKKCVAIEATTRHFHNETDLLKCACTVIEDNFKDGCITYLYTVSSDTPSSYGETRIKVRYSSVKIGQERDQS
jgi:hypothetical protein